MSAYREFSGKSVEEALKNAREEFGVELNDLDFEILTAGSRGVLGMGAEPDLFFDGRCCCDQSAAHRLVSAGYIAAASLGLVGQRVAAALTVAGKHALGATPVVAA